MTCVDGNCVDVPPEDISPGANDGIPSAALPDSNGNSSWVIETDCPEGQIFQYGMCHTPVPESHYNNSQGAETGGCHANDKPVSPWFALIWLGAIILYISIRAKRD